MISALISRIVILLFGTLYPAYASYKAVRTKDVKEYVKWMMYWIVFALFTSAETFTDLFFSFWFPFYYEIKIVLVVYLLSPATKGSSILYRKFVHPTLTRREQEIDEYIARAKEQGYHTVLTLGSKGVNYATAILMQTAIKGGGGLVSHIRKSYSLVDLPGEQDTRRSVESRDELDDTYPEDTRVVRRRRATSPRRTVSSGSQVDLYFPEVDARDTPISDNFIPSHIRSSEDVSLEPLQQESKERLTRTSSVSSTSRIRTRASVKAERTTSVPEEWTDAAEDLVDESPSECDISPSQNIEPPAAGKVLSPLVRPHLQYLFANLSEEELVSLVSSAPITAESSKNNEGPSRFLSKLIANESSSKSPSPVKKDQSHGVIDNNGRRLSLESSDQQLKNEERSEAASVAVDSDLANKELPVNCETDGENTRSRIVKRPKKRQAPVAPAFGGSLVDLHRLSQISQISDQIEVSSVMELDLSITPDSSPSPSNISLNDKKTNKIKSSESSISKILQFPKFWQKSKVDDPPVTEAVLTEELPASATVYDSYISLHEDPSPAPEGERLRDMSQSPSSKRRSQAL